MGCENCKLTDRVVIAERDIQELQQGRSHADIKAERMETMLEYIKSAVDDLKDKIDKITEAPRKRWDTVINTTIAGIVAAIVAAVMMLILK